MKNAFDSFDFVFVRLDERDQLGLNSTQATLGLVPGATETVPVGRREPNWKGDRMFKFEAMAIPDVIVIIPQVFGDSRGYFLETYKETEFGAAGIHGPFVQDNESSSSKGVLRGLHFQKEHTQGKLVRVTSGRVLDVAVDVRPQSPTFGKYVSVELDAESKKMFWIPKGFAHGFLVLSDQAIFTYKCTDVYDPSSEGGIPWDDKTLAISWPKLDIPYKTSQKDSQHPAFMDQDFSWAANF